MINELQLTVHLASGRTIKADPQTAEMMRQNYREETGVEISDEEIQNRLELLIDSIGQLKSLNSITIWVKGTRRIFNPEHVEQVDIHTR